MTAGLGHGPMAVYSAPHGGSGSIVIGGGGSVAVATATLFSHARQLDDLSTDLDECRRLVDRADAMVGRELLTIAGAPRSALRAEAAMEDALRLIADAGRSSKWLAQGLRTSADVYGVTEDAVTRLVQTLAAETGRALGFTGAAVGIVMLPFVLGAATIVGSGWALAAKLDPHGTRRAVGRLGELIDSQRHMLSDPAFVAITRLAVTSADDVLSGALLIPAPIGRALGDEGLGVIGTDTVASGLVAVGSTAVGALTETKVRATAGAPVAATPVSGLAARVDRIPTGDARVRVDRYRMPGGDDRFEVYVGGTRDFSPMATDDPFDLTSTVVAMSGSDSGSYRAVKQALADAGVTSQSEVVLTGYSLGGLVAAELAASGDYHVTGLYTVGAPAAQVAVPADVPWLAIEHTDDLVPAVGGNWMVSDPLLVRRRAAGDALDSGLAFPAHELERYRETAMLADAADERRLAAWRSRADGQGGGAVDVVSISYAVERMR